MYDIIDIHKYGENIPLSVLYIKVSVTLFVPKTMRKFSFLCHVILTYDNREPQQESF